MMYSYPYGMYRPYYSYYNRYGARASFPTESRVWNDEAHGARHDSRHNVGQVQSSKQGQVQGNVKTQKQAQMQCQAQPQRHGHSQVQEQSQAHDKAQDLSQQEDRCEEKPIFDLFGIRLFSDDLLILAVLYFLYSEGVQDPELFIALILLLIS